MSFAAKVELYISKRPYIKEALATGIVNYSALARKICYEEDIDSENAVKVALSRYEDHISQEREERRSEVKQVLDDTSMEVKPGLKVVKKELEDSIVSAETFNGHISVMEGGSKALISLESPQKLENTPGVIAFILSSLAAEGINVDHMISCREDTHLLVDNSEASQVMEILQKRI